MNDLRYAIDHSGLHRDENSDYDSRMYYERSGALGIIAQCMDTHDDTVWIGYKTVRFYHDYIENDIEMEKLIKEELRKKFAKKFRYCDDCEHKILEQIERDYA
jgi:hypothetical protein